MTFVLCQFPFHLSRKLQPRDPDLHGGGTWVRVTLLGPSEIRFSYDRLYYLFFDGTGNMSPVRPFGSVSAKSLSNRRAIAVG